MRLSDFRRPLEKISHPTDLIGGVFPRGYFTIIASKPGVGKTWLMLKISSELSVGGKIFDGLVVSEPPRKVLIFAGETGSEMIENRVSSTSWNFSSENIIVYSLFECVSQGVNLFLNQEEGIRNVERIIENERPDVVFFDTLVSFHTSDENSQKDMSLIYSVISKAAKKYDCAIILMHHLRKGQQNGVKQAVGQDEVIGTSLTSRLAGVIFIISRQNDNTMFPVNTVTNVKNWNAQIPTFNYQIKVTGGVVDLEYDFAPQLGITIRQKLQNFITANMIENRDYTVDEIGSILGVNRSVLRSYLKEYVQKGTLTQRIEDRKYIFVK